MKKTLSGLLLAMFIAGFALVASPGAVNAAWVNGYYRSNGIYVSGYYRSNPNAYKFDNYSYRGGSQHNTSYYTPTKSYTSTWYTPSYITQPSYYTGLNYYNAYGGGSLGSHSGLRW